MNWKLIGVAVFLLSSSANSQDKLDALGELLIVGASLNTEDIFLALQSGRQEMDGQPVGTTIDWDNPQSGNSGTVTLRRSFQEDGRDCRENRHTIRLKEREDRTLDIIMCRDGRRWVRQSAVVVVEE